MIIRPETKADRQAIFNINLQAFNSKIEPELVDRLRDSDWFVPDLALAAEQEGVLVGYALFTRIPSRRENGDMAIVISLGPVAVLPELQNQGVGSKLIREGLKKCTELGYSAVVLVGHPEYYPRFGFVPARSQGFSLPLVAPDDAFMVVELIPNELAKVRGTIEYPPEWGL